MRGEFTYSLFTKYGSVENVHNTGCPSFFSRLGAFAQLCATLEAGSSLDRTVFAGSLHHLKDPKEQLYRAIDHDLYLIEPVNGKLHQYYIDILSKGREAPVAYFLKELLARPEWSVARLADYMVKRYRLFRDLESWIAFNRESTDGAIGTRFHVNMASLLSGRPAVWVVHDSRTVELCERLSLPHVTVEESLQVPYRELLANADFGPMFEHLSENFASFNAFLDVACLPRIEAPGL